MILLLSNKDDLTTDLVVSRLQDERAPIFRLNVEDLSSTPLAFASLDPLRAELRPGGVDLHLREVRSVWNRRPGRPSIPEGLPTDVAFLVQQEYAEVLQGLRAFMPRDCFWMNDPLVNDGAANKLTQMKFVVDHGYPFARTLLTNDPALAWEFYRAGQQILCKTMRQGVFSVAGEARGIYSWLLPATMKERDFDSVANCPTLLQEWIPKVADIRTTVIGANIFSVRIDSQACEDTRVDWRVPDLYKLAHTEVPTPRTVAVFIQDLMSFFGLSFAALDFVEAANGEWIFLEINPNGQWAWLESLAGVKISNAIAAALIQAEDLDG